MIDVLNTPLWESKVPHVQEMLCEMHKEAIKARGEAFTFRIRMYEYTTHYRYASGFFSSPEWKMTTLCYDRNAEAEFKQAAACLREYITYTTTAEQKYDTRSVQAKVGDTASECHVWYAVGSVSKAVSTQIYQAYEAEGGKFREKLLREHFAILDRVVGLLSWDIEENKRRGANNSLIFYLAVTENTARFNKTEHRFADMGMQPLSTAVMRYGFVTAMIERAMPQLTPHGTVTVQVRPGPKETYAEVSLRFSNETTLKAW